MPKKKRTPAELAKIADENWRNRHKKKVVKAKPKKKAPKVVIYDDPSVKPIDMGKLKRERLKKERRIARKAKPKPVVVKAKPVVVDAKILERRRKARERYALKKKKRLEEKAKADYIAEVERKGGKVVRGWSKSEIKKQLPRYKTFDPELIRQGVAGGDKTAALGWVLGHEPFKPYKLFIHGQTERAVREDFMFHHGFDRRNWKPSAVRREGEKERADVEETYRTRLPEFRNALGRYNRRAEEWKRERGM